MIVVANAGPLLALAQIDQLYILPALYGEIHIPPAVRKEVLAYGRERPGAAEVGDAPWIRIDHVRERTAVQLLLERLDAGESAAIVLAPSYWRLSSRPICCSSMKPGDVVLPRRAA